MESIENYVTKRPSRSNLPHQCPLAGKGSIPCTAAVQHCPIHEIREIPENSQCVQWDGRSVSPEFPWVNGLRGRAHHSSSLFFSSGFESAPVFAGPGEAISQRRACTAQLRYLIDRKAGRRGKHLVNLPPPDPCNSIKNPVDERHC